MATEKASSLSKRRSRGKLDRLIKAAEHTLEEDKIVFENYVRRYRLVYGVDPDLDEVSDEWPPHEIIIDE